MPISYPLSLPSTKSPARISISSQNVASVSRSPFTLASQVQSFQGQLWLAEVTLPPMARADAEQWVCWLLKLNGRAGTFLLGDTAGKTARGAFSGSPVVNGSSQTGQTLSIRGLTAGVTGIVKAGDFLQIGYRLYKSLSDANSNGSGVASLDIWPRIRESPGDGTAVVTANCQGLFRLRSNDVQLYDVSGDFNYSVAFSAEEAL